MSIFALLKYVCYHHYCHYAIPFCGLTSSSLQLLAGRSVRQACLALCLSERTLPRSIPAWCHWRDLSWLGYCSLRQLGAFSDTRLENLTVVSSKLQRLWNHLPVKIPIILIFRKISSPKVTLTLVGWTIWTNNPCLFVRLSKLVALFSDIFDYSGARWCRSKKVCLMSRAIWNSWNREDCAEILSLPFCDSSWSCCSSFMVADVQGCKGPFPFSYFFNFFDPPSSCPVLHQSLYPRRILLQAAIPRHGRQWLSPAGLELQRIGPPGGPNHRQLLRSLPFRLPLN